MHVIFLSSSNKSVFTEVVEVNRFGIALDFYNKWIYKTRPY